MVSVTQDTTYTFCDGDADVSSEPGQVVLTGMAGDGRVIRFAIAEVLFDRVVAAMIDVRAPVIGS
jgi:hypothetical protein